MAIKYDNCKDCQSRCVHAGKDREFVCINGQSCKVTAPKPKTYTLEEIADLICNSYGECCETTCPGFDYCRQNKNGVLTWLEKLEKGDLQGR